MGDIYAANRREYSGLIETVVRGQRGWRICTVLAMLIAFAAVGGVVYLGSQTKIRPVLVVLDEDHQPVGIYEPGPALAPEDERVTKATLAQFVRTWREVSIDPVYQRRKVNQLNRYINRGSPAFEKIKDYILSPTNNPLHRGTTETVSVRITNVLPVSGSTWQIDWQETTTQRQSGQSVSQRYQATITFTFLDAVPPEILLTNPTGLLVSDLNWSESGQ